MSKGSERFVVDERVGIIAVRDTQHPNYDSSGCLSDARDIAASWCGVVSIETRQKAAAVCRVLNKFGRLDKSMVSLIEELMDLIRVVADQG